MPISTKSSRNQKISEADFVSFEKELLAVLKNDKDHHIDFDGRLIFHSGRFNCDLAATDVHWDPNKGDLVLVGAVRNGALIDESKGFPEFKSQVEIPFRECYEDMRRQEQFNEAYLISKTKKSVLDKYIIKPLDMLETAGLIQGGAMFVEDFGLKAFNFGDAKVTGIHKNAEGRITLTSNGSAERPPVLENSLSMIQVFGENITKILDTYNAAKKDFVDARWRIVGDNQSHSDYDEMHANSEGMATLYEKGYNARICDAVTRNIVGSSFFDLDKNDVKDIVKAVKDYRQKNVLIQKNTKKQQVKSSGPSM